ncbi:hypothetical protein BCR36DRAFT_343531 [Piromyces finnis]|uniref:RGS domain-containing protein n=1 Tax=Piromyces finnis TaxID=1754191 RepID=A0A1Y1VJX6_9FUNG|nr:hypothetical protein BCR36DRAFT_343531 [Piromyces finnis]|eukprot:ORX58391.1 hypothetical protein BCR36DRAFT_343531 [Piromyces finnis]
MSIGVPLVFLGVVGKALLLNVEYINTIKKEKINGMDKYNELFLKSDLERVNSDSLRDNNSTKMSVSSIPKSFSFMKYITPRNILIVTYTVDAICIIYSIIAQNYSDFYKINHEYGYCNNGTWEFIPLYVIFYVSTIVSSIIYVRILYLKNRKVKVSKKMIIYILIGFFIFILYLGFSYSPTLHFKFFFITREIIFSIFVIYVHILFIGGPVYRMLNMVYLQENLNKSMNSLKFVLDNPELCSEFSKYCTVELCIENLIFHKKITKLKKEMEEYEQLKLTRSTKEIEDFKKLKLSLSRKGSGKDVNVNISPRIHEESGLEVIYEYYNDFYKKSDKFLNDDFNEISQNNYLNDIDEIKSYRNNINSNYIPLIFIPDVKEIYKKFIAHDSIFEINISNSIYQKISNEVNNGDEEYILKNIFDEADNEVLNILYTNIYGKFIKAQKNKKTFDDFELMINQSSEE